ncbi:bifunctional ornithine acetyltransferase/N-acetylglutamate synthase [Pseudoflavonifractor sp. DSM 107456]|uniref:Arginine biosynthesis bifunctional protein ArgJ n=1 Tax=Pseudoflavonifractor gallinarum TaxID=2779352 RepID=A0ABR9RC94_9FIRM|nr:MULTISPECIES: bifunctional ornithine acetyltransferase/N-acetylglutamate synthase [Pseudoflavonifractor]MBE5056326.1 bifunctional ornithine acetyltransferase/N-acetylglutamate synthase [Pseudoflavonifractor gallinarum]MBT9683363.1 bifunctional ornithine acetyltransferase/N-acetylglutamate synthase [Pseudoflavonifractor sp. MCC625]
MKQINGGVTAAKGFRAWGVHCGVKSKKLEKKDLAIILSERECAAAATYTMNRVKAAPIYVTMDHLEDGTAWGVVANSGNANACCPQSHENAELMSQYAAQATGHKPSDFVVASTGVIGQTINIAAIERGMPEVAAGLTDGPEGSDAAAHAIMTTDTSKKEIAISFTLGGKTVTMGAIAKGSGMIHPNMGTMLCFITTDCAITGELLSDALHEVVPKTFNRVTVDGDTSTNDMCVVLANGMAENPLIEWKDDSYTVFRKALHQVCEYLARCIAGDGEGASRLITCTVHEARSEESAERLSKAVVGSPLVKAAMFGTDANWGRVLCAMGYSKAPFRPEYVDVKFASAVGEVLVCQQGMGLDFDEEAAKSILSQDEVIIDICLHEGEHEATCWGCDLTYDYVKINGDYRT